MAERKKKALIFLEGHYLWDGLIRKLNYSRKVRRKMLVYALNLHVLFGMEHH